MTFRMHAWIFNLESVGRICVLGTLFRMRDLGRTFWICILSLGLGLVSEECYFGRVQVIPYLSFSFVDRLFGTWRISWPSFVFSSLPLFLIGLFTLFGTPWAKGGVLARDLARWLVWRSGACGPHRPPPAPMLRSSSSPGSDAFVCFNHTVFTLFKV
jgi:hypothetical protein